METIAAKVDSKLLRHMCAFLSRIPTCPDCCCRLLRGARSRYQGRSPRSRRCIIAIVGACRHFHSTLIVGVLNFTEKKKFTQTRVFHFIGQIYRSAGSVGKFSIYQLVERLMQRNDDDVIAPVALSPVEWLFSEFICPIGEKVREGG